MHTYTHTCTWTHVYLGPVYWNLSAVSPTHCLYPNIIICTETYIKLKIANLPSVWHFSRVLFTYLSVSRLFSWQVTAAVSHLVGCSMAAKLSLLLSSFKLWHFTLEHFFSFLWPYLSKMTWNMSTCSGRQKVSQKDTEQLEQPLSL
jgi:hypothetical protein